MNALPSEWRLQRLGDLGYAYSGLSGKSKDDFGTGSKYVPYKNVFLNTFVDLTNVEKVYVSTEEAQNKVQKGDVLLTISSETPEEVGMSAVVANNVADDLYLNSFCFGFRPTTEELLPRYLGYAFRSSYMRKKLTFLAQGSTRFNISKARVLEIELPIPPKGEQQKVADILTAIDDKLDVIARQIEATQTLKQGLMQTLLRQGVGTRHVDGHWVPHAEFKDSELGEIPAGWEVTTVGDVCEVKGGKRLPKGESLTNENTGFPYIRVTDMYMGGVDTEGVLFVPPQVQPSIARYTISKDDIFISVAGTLGLVGVVPAELDGANLTENADKLTDIKICRDFLLYCLCSDGIQGAIAREGTSNAQPKLALARIREFSIPLPTRPEQERIAAILKSIGDKLATLQSKENRYQSLKRGLMQKLLTGEWRVSVDASVNGS